MWDVYVDEIGSRNQSSTILNEYMYIIPFMFISFGSCRSLFQDSQPHADTAYSSEWYAAVSATGTVLIL